MSIIIPCHGRLDLTERCLKSIYEHTTDIELILVDNGSIDEHWDYFPSLQVTRISIDKNLGFARGCNIGAAAAKYDPLFLNNDTEVRAGWLDPLRAALDDRDVGAVAGRLEFPDGRLQHAGVRLFVRGVLTAENIETEQPAGEVQVVAGAALLVRREAWNSVAGFDPAFYNGYEDVDLCLRLGEAGWKIRYEPESTVMHHAHGSGPERWARVRENIALLDERWRDKMIRRAQVNI